MKKLKLILFLILISLNIETAHAIIKLEPSEIFLGVNNDTTLKISDANSNNISWTSSDQTIATVDNNGKITGISLGEAYIKVSDGDSMAICKVKIIDNYIPVSNIKLNKNEETLLLNSVIKINYTILPATSSNKMLVYKSSNSDIATVNPNGYITAKKVGTANISVFLEDKTAILKINVIDKIPLQEIKLPETMQIQKGQSTKLTVIYNPTNATNREIIWESNNTSIVTIDKNGNINGIAPGVATITAKSVEGNHIATTKVTVTSPDEIKLKGITLNKIETLLNIGTEEQLSIIFNPQDATNKTITWKSDDSKIVTVDNNGKIKAISLGTTTITAISADGKYESKCIVTVSDNSENRKLKSIKLNKKRITLKQGEQKKLDVTFEPNDAINKEIIWSSSDETIVTVKDGNITAISPGIAEIKITSIDGNYEDKCNVVVYSSLPIETISFENSNYDVYIGYTITLNTISSPENTMIDNPIWTSSNEDVAIVNDGVVTGINAGSATITISDDKNEIIASTTINVTTNPNDKLSITIDGYDLKFDPDVKNYILKIKNESTLNIKTNYDPYDIIISGNQNLKNGSIITITPTNNTKLIYIIKIKKKETNITWFIVIISILVIINIARLLNNNKKAK